MSYLYRTFKIDQFICFTLFLYLEGHFREADFTKSNYMPTYWCVNIASRFSINNNKENLHKGKMRLQQIPSWRIIIRCAVSRFGISMAELYILGYVGDSVLHSLSGRSSYRKLSWSLEAWGLVVKYMDHTKFCQGCRQLTWRWHP